jgi:hypothetical protein
MTIPVAIPLLRHHEEIISLVNRDWYIHPRQVVVKSINPPKSGGV